MKGVVNAPDKGGRYRLAGANRRDKYSKAGVVEIL
jgi:hypothetical protein